MIGKLGYSIPGVWAPTGAETAKQLAGPCEISSIKLAAGGSAAFVKIYDSVGSADSSSLKWVLDASSQTVDSHDFPYPMNFEKGVYAVCEQGAAFTPFVCIAKVTPR